jgi:hypothetical protein
MGSTLSRASSTDAGTAQAADEQEHRTERSRLQRAVGEVVAQVRDHDAVARA